MHQSSSTATLKAKLTNDYNAADEPAIIATAQEVWMSLYKGTRVSHGPRMHKGIPRLTTTQHSEAGWLRKRRASVK